MGLGPVWPSSCGRLLHITQFKSKRKSMKHSSGLHEARVPPMGVLILIIMLREEGMVFVE